jgi:hypothetical protein
MSWIFGWRFEEPNLLQIGPLLNYWKCFEKYYVVMGSQLHTHTHTHTCGQKLNYQNYS